MFHGGFILSGGFWAFAISGGVNSSESEEMTNTGKFGNGFWTCFKKINGKDHP